jgi:membrane-associated PAP2 superfamily phosphatase
VAPVRGPAPAPDPARIAPPAAGPPDAFWRRDLAVAAVGLLLLVLWEASGADLAVSAWFGGPQGFGWRDAWLTRDLLHQGGRWLSGLVLAALVLDVLRCAWLARRGPPRRAGPGWRERLLWLAVVVALIVLVPLLKRASHSSCPWDLQPFGGAFPYVPHWDLLRRDGGPGRCFPSGHAVAALAFLPLYPLWRAHRPARARGLLALVLLAGLLFGAAQTARGAHFVSHTLWTGWLCWAGCALVSTLLALRHSVRSPA